MHNITYVQPVAQTQQTIPINTVYQDIDYIPVRAKIHTAEFNFNGTIMLNREDLMRGISLVNFQP